MNKIAVFATLLIVSVGHIHAQEAEEQSINKAHRHDFVRMGNEGQDLKIGDYVVIARTLNEEDAIKFIKEIKKEKLPVPKYGYQSNQKFWFIYFDGNEDIEQARAKREELIVHAMFKGAYLLTIHQ